MNELVSSRLEQLDAKQDGYVLDGYPHTHAQIQFLNSRGLVPDKVRSAAHSADTCHGWRGACAGTHTCASICYSSGRPRRHTAPMNLGLWMTLAPTRCR
jgi:hypothetical protein